MTRFSPDRLTFDTRVETALLVALPVLLSAIAVLVMVLT